MTDVDSAGRREGKKGGKPSKPSKFVPGKINHTGLISDDLGLILPMWFNEMDPNAKDPNMMAYQPLRFVFIVLIPVRGYLIILVNYWLNLCGRRAVCRIAKRRKKCRQNGNVADKMPTRETSSKYIFDRARLKRRRRFNDANV